MKKIIFIPFIFLLACDRPELGKKKPSIDTVVNKTNTNKDYKKFYATTDSVIVFSKHPDKVVYTKKEFNEIIDNFPVLLDSFPLHPDISYVKSGIYKEFVDADGNKKVISFNSEVGKDSYFILYSYFLKKLNKDKELSARRETIINIYRDLNNIFCSLYHGGTYYGHQERRIFGYAEYSVYQYKEDKDFFNKTYSIIDEKKLFIASLRQEISDEISIDNEIPTKEEKVKKQNDILKYVENLNILISDNFYLKKSQEFRYSNY